MVKRNKRENDDKRGAFIYIMCLKKGVKISLNKRMKQFLESSLLESVGI